MPAPTFTYSGNVYTAGTAGTVDFALVSTTGNVIPYLEAAHVHVYKSSNQGATWTELTRPSQWDFVTNGTVARLATGIASGDWVKVQRITPSSSAYVTFQPSSLLTADQLNDDTLFNTYLNQERYDQGDQSTTVAAAASTAAAAATATANTALSTANSASTSAASATSTANTAATNAANSLSQSNTALTQSSTALSNSAAAVTTANAASADAATSLTQSAAAVTTANNSQTVANTAATNATAATNTANTASTNAATALSQSNTALSQSATALSQSSTALSQSSTALANSSSAVTTANTANNNATAALNAVAAAVQYVLVTNVAAIPASPVNAYAIEVVDSTGIESFSPVTNRPAGFVGDSGLSVRLQYSSAGSTWNWLGYYSNNPESRYLKLSGGTLTGQLKASSSTSTAAPVYSFDGDTDTGVAHTGANELALVTGGTPRLTFDSSGNATFANSVTIPAGSTVAGYLETSTAASTYQPQAGMTAYAPLASPTFTGTVTIPAGASISGYLTSAIAASTYQTQAGMSSYLTTAAAGSTYAPLASPTFTGTVTIPAGASISGYLTSATAASTYQTQSGMSSYLTTSAASSTYAPLASPTFTGTVTIPAGASISGYAPTATPTFTGQPYVNGSYRGNVTAVAALNIDCSLGNLFTKTINGNNTFTVSNVPASRSYAFTLELTHTSGTITWFSGVVWPGGTAPTLTTGKVHLFMFFTDDGGTTWRASSLINY